MHHLFFSNMPMEIHCDKKSRARDNSIFISAQLMFEFSGAI